MRRSGRLLLGVLLLLFIWPDTTVFATTQGTVPIKIIIDPGHGGRDPGAIGVNGIYEKDVNLDISQRLKELLVAEGYEVIMTRETDQLLVEYAKSSEKQADLQARVDVATNAGADVFVSIHANSYNASSKGTMVLYYDPIKWSSRYVPTQAMVKWSSERKKLAQQIQASITTQLGTKNLGIIPSNLYVVRSGTVPSVLVETAFLSNWEEAEKLKSPDFRQTMALAIKDGILQYRPVRYVDIVNHWAKAEIAALSNQGIIQGYADNTFRPEKVLTRGELISLLDKTNKFSNPSVAETLLPFTDVPEDYWAYDSVVAAYEKGIIEGYEDSTFRPNQKVTREEMAAILYRLYFDESRQEEAETVDTPDIEEPEKVNMEENTTSEEKANTEEAVQDDTLDELLEDELVEVEFNEEETNIEETVEDTQTLVQFNDVPEDHWSSKAIAELQSKGLIKGIEADYFGFGQGIKRAEAAIIIFRLLQNNLYAA